MIILKGGEFMKKLFLTFIMISLIGIFSACSPNGTNTNQGGANQNRGTINAPNLNNMGNLNTQPGQGTTNTSGGNNMNQTNTQGGGTTTR
jgi:hypothetical protein